MVKLFPKIDKKFDHLAWTMASTGLILLLLSVLIVWTDFMLRLVIGLIVLVIAYMFLYGGYKIWSMKNEIKKHLGLK
ncbi:MAG: hypothetical protein MUC28_04340 [Planctomycetes bacterium]|nr:hypothetical protein [Planctomycetota bacterium]